MAEATLARGGTTVTLPLLGEGAGEPVVVTTIGKPEASAASQGALNPRWSDQWSQLESRTLRSRLTAADAYATARTLADLIKSHSDGSNLTLNIDLPEVDSDIPVAPAPEQDQAVSIAYDPGQTDWVDVELSVTRVTQTLGSGDQTATTPTASGDGPIQLSGPSNTVSFEHDVVVDRTIGRPNTAVRRSTDKYPNYQDTLKAAMDRFDIGAQFVDNAATKIQNLQDMVGQKLGRGALTLDFQGIYGMRSFDVVPEGSGALRYVRPSGEAGTIVVPSITLRRVTT